MMELIWQPSEMLMNATGGASRDMSNYVECSLRLKMREVQQLKDTFWLAA